MARKQSITKEMLQEAAFSLAKTEGIESVTARRVAQAAGCSTQPIFRAYENMEELQAEVIKMAGDFFCGYYDNAPKKSDKPFVDLAMAYINFSIEYEKLFALLFVSHYKKDISTYEFINGGEKMFVLKELKRMNDVPAKKAGEVFSNLWIFVHGMATMVLNGDYDLTEDECRENIADIIEKLKH